jgi:peptidoglycan DL-endopeptidase CwlO
VDQATQTAMLLADKMLAHRGKLQVDTKASQSLQDALTQSAHEVTTSRESQATDAKNLLEHWNSDAADHFDSQSKHIGTELSGVSSAGTQAVSIVGGLAQQVGTAHDATQQLIDEYQTRAGTLLRAGQAVQGAGGSAAVLSSYGQVIDLANSYAKETGQILSAADGTAKNAAGQLKALTSTLKGDTIADPHVGGHTATGSTKGDGKQHTPPKDPKPTHKPTHQGDGKDGGKDGGKHKPAHGDGKTKGSGDGKDKGGTKTKTASKIISAAKSNIGYHETGDNIDKFGPAGQPWCSYFATAMWRKAGVNIPNYGFTGDVYDWGKAHHLAYGKDNLNDVRPGDVLLFGTGPQNANTSTHIGIVEAVHGNTVTTIEGNEGDAVRVETHTLSSSTFYGGVHPS